MLLYRATLDCSNIAIEYQIRLQFVNRVLVMRCKLVEKINSYSVCCYMVEKGVIYLVIKSASGSLITRWEGLGDGTTLHLRVKVRCMHHTEHD